MTSAELKQWRANLLLSQRAAASELGITLTAYQVLERGTSFATGKTVKIDRRTELACLYLAEKLAKAPF